MEFPTIDEFAKEVAEKALDEFIYEGKTIREWVEIIIKQQPCEDTISRQAAIDAICKEGTRLERNGTVAMCEIKQWCIDLLERLPSAQPERKTGKWNAYYHGINETPSFTYSCNQCGYSAPYGLYGGKYSQKEWNFCPNCGAKMESEDVNND